MSYDKNKKKRIALYFIKIKAFQSQKGDFFRAKKKFTTDENENVQLVVEL